jgi:DNA-directed RNA polymerase specialized sigma24 family protein
MRSDELPPQQDLPTDLVAADLMRAVQRGERAAFEQLFFGYHGRLSDVLSWLAPPEQVDVLAREVFWTVWDRAAEFRFEVPVLTWLLTLAYPIVLKTSRPSTQPTRRDFAYRESFESRVPIEPALARGLGVLPIEQRIIVILVFCVHCSPQEIASITSTTVQAVTCRLQRALHMLRECHSAADRRNSRSSPRDQWGTRGLVQ